MLKLPTQPMVQAFLVCREMEIRDDDDVILVGPCSRITVAQFPAEAPVAVFAHLTDARGRYQVTLRLEDGDGETVWDWQRYCVVEEANPLMPHRIALADV